jgi:hypothetical protein
MWALCFIKEHSRKCFPTRFLLANGRRRCGSDCEVLQRVPILCKADPRAHPRAPNHLHHMAFHHVGHEPLEILQKTLGGLTHLLVMVNKFTKWIKARPLAKIGSKKVVSFVQDIVFHFGVPNSIITNNSTND